MNRAASNPSTCRQKLRCAIYTRKSSEEGLEQEFNSLDAQREACAAFIASQRHEGWTALPQVYDDGGFSGGSMERPALRRLLADIAAGKIDVVVVYKVDRLTRALADFAKMVEIFDAKAVSFVSVTQAFNTTSSMGRLTLNVLLSFAQFEREVTGERIRDKIAASKKKGIWMGGQPALGYDVQDRKLVVNPAEADTVRHVFRRYVDLRSVRLLRDELAAAGIVSKTRRAADGSSYGARPLARGALYLMLANRVYRGEIVHKGTAYPGAHLAIIDVQLWDEVQALLASNRNGEAGGGANEPSLLAGLIVDAVGEGMTPTHATNRGKRYRYYVSRRLITGTSEQAGGGWRLPAPEIERLVFERIRAWLMDPAMIDSLPQRLTAPEQQQLIAQARALASQSDHQRPNAYPAKLIGLLSQIRIHPDRIEVDVDPQTFLPRSSDAELGRDPNGETITTLIIPATLKRAGIGMRMVMTDGSQPARVEPGLIKLVLRARRIRDRLIENPSLGLIDIAREEKVVGSYATRVIRLAWLAPDIVTAIIEGRQPPELTVRKLMDDTRLPLDWADQRRALGFA